MIWTWSVLCIVDNAPRPNMGNLSNQRLHDGPPADLDSTPTRAQTNPSTREPGLVSGSEWPDKHGRLASCLRPSPEAHGSSRHIHIPLRRNNKIHNRPCYNAAGSGMATAICGRGSIFPEAGNGRPNEAAGVAVQCALPCTRATCTTVQHPSVRFRSCCVGMYLPTHIHTVEYYRYVCPVGGVDDEGRPKEGHDPAGPVWPRCSDPHPSPVTPASVAPRAARR